MVTLVSVSWNSPPLGLKYIQKVECSMNPAISEGAAADAAEASTDVANSPEGEAKAKAAAEAKAKADADAQAQRDRTKRAYEGVIGLRPCFATGKAAKTAKRHILGRQILQQIFADEQGEAKENSSEYSEDGKAILAKARYVVDQIVKNKEAIVQSFSDTLDEMIGNLDKAAQVGVTIRGGITAMQFCLALTNAKFSKSEQNETMYSAAGVSID